MLWLVSTRAIQASRLSISAPSILASTAGLTAFSVREHDGDDGWQSRFRIGALGLLPYTNHIAKQTKWHARIGLALMLEEQIEAAHGASNVGAKEQIALPFFERFVDVASGLKRERVPVGRFDERLGQQRLERDGGVLRLREHSFTRAFWFPYRERERRAELSSSRRGRRRVHVRALTRTVSAAASNGARCQVGDASFFDRERVRAAAVEGLTVHNREHPEPLVVDGLNPAPHSSKRREVVAFGGAEGSDGRHANVCVRQFKALERRFFARPKFGVHGEANCSDERPFRQKLHPDLVVARQKLTVGRERKLEWNRPAELCRLLRDERADIDRGRRRFAPEEEGCEREKKRVLSCHPLLSRCCSKRLAIHPTSKWPIGFFALHRLKEGAIRMHAR